MSNGPIIKETGLRTILFTIVCVLALLLFIYPSVLYAGVGGGVEGKEKVDIVPLIKWTLVFLAGMGTVFGIGIAFAAKRFAVQIDPRVEKVKDHLAHAHCGACGYAGCEQYAEAVVNKPEVAPNLCIPAGAKGAEAVALITGKKAEIREPQFARIMCQGGCSKSVKRFKYEGVQDCRAAILAGGGDKACRYGCLGYGTCSRVCPFGAISMTDDNLPFVDITKCTGCRKCEQACPTKVIEVLPASRQVLVTCHSKDKGGDTRKNCEIGCIACGICVKVCPFDAPSVTNNLSRIDLDKCKVCGLCVTKCPTKAISDFIPQRPKAFVMDNCIGCQICAKVCPVNAPSGEMKKMHVIDKDRCIGCGICTAKCPVQAIDGTFNAQEVFAAAAAKKAKKVEAA
ncbi:MAG TPA: 4Fe-4S binding protein [Candidatus Sulfobium mesophilum]|uniref:Ion-translocating oxidoreductase complex subunit B n=1 Tax=Candidatus Sulfobium mesophilum TaxID=2016548 RepID=A0A2U3QGH8_9BACT|nr:Putative electron transport complex protein RnfB [Candidatus Sulfobium mesophilum]HSB31827.1 4Fe-4S binding protein [Candidatus Sulfobium mesophilum]